MENRVLGNSSIVCPATEKFPRHSEADVVKLTDGRLLLVWGRKTDGNDTSEGEIVGMFSSDGGVTWDENPHIIRTPWAECRNAMSVSFCRTPRGLHLFYVGHDVVPPGEDVERGMTTIYQSISTDEGGSWSHPMAISVRHEFQVLNNARVIRTTTGRLLAPISAVDGPIHEFYDFQRVFCLFSDDDGLTWAESNLLEIRGVPLMEPGVAECPDGSIYMTIRTKLGFLYEARSYDQGATWVELQNSAVPSAEAPSTVVRDPKSGDLWMFWCNTPYEGHWYARHDIAIAVSRDSGRSWGPALTLEHNKEHSYGYVSVTVVQDYVLMTYYDWVLEAEKPNAGLFNMTSLRQRIVPLKTLAGLSSPEPIFA